MKKIDLDNWNRKQHFYHFTALSNPYFGVTFPLDVTITYKKCKSAEIGFFVKYLHGCMKAINQVENLRLRIINGKVYDIETVHASATIMRQDKTFGFSWIHYHDDFSLFNNNFLAEKLRVQSCNDLYPTINGANCIHCSAMPWINFSSQQEPVSGNIESIPKISFGKATNIGGKKIMNVAISVNHALVDGYHIGLFIDLFQQYLNE